MKDAIKGYLPACKRNKGEKDMDMIRFRRLTWIMMALGIFITGLELSHSATDRETKSLCLECHSKAVSLIDKPVVHSPVKEGKCTACHNPHASKYSGLLTDSDSNLCYNCHEREKGFAAKVVHKPVEDGKCLSCHDPHSSANPSLLKKTGAKSCFSCHPQEKIMAGKNIHPEVKKGNCTSCHSPHASSNDGLLLKERKAVCAGCHYPEGGKRHARQCIYNVSGADCTGCHSPHSSDRRGLLKAELHAPFKEKKCGSCHKEGEPYSVDKVISQCMDCHKSTMAGFNKINSHLTGGVKDPCTTCHNPHASDEKHLFRDKMGKVCYECHGDSKVHVANSKYKHPGLDRCSDCHVSHGSNNVFFLSGGPGTCSSENCHPAQGTFTHPVGEKIIDPRSKTPMDCSTCHNPMGSPEKFILRLEKDRELCVQCHRQ